MKGHENMLKLTWIEFFLRGIPESFAIIWAICIVSNKRIDKSKYVICSIALALVAFSVRFLPIHFGIHIILNNVFTVYIVVISGIPVFKSIYSTIITTLLLIVGELINAVIFNVFKLNTDILLKSTFLKCIVELPSLIFFILSIVLIRFLINSRKGIRDKFN